MSSALFYRNCDLEEVSSSVPEQPVTPAAPEKPVIKVKSFATVPEEDTTALAKPVENKVCSLFTQLLIIMYRTIDKTS